MPRKAKRTQAPQAPQDQGYGVRGEQIAAQHAMPLPDNRSTPTSTPNPSNPASVASPSPEQAPMQDPVQAMLAAAQQMAPPGILQGASARPDEPVTAGLEVGAGPGPEALQFASEPRPVMILRDLVRMTGDSKLASLLSRASEQ